MAYNRHFTQYINISLHHPEYNQGPTTEPNKERKPKCIDPRSPQPGSSTDRPERKHSNVPNPRRTSTWVRSCPLHWHRRHLHLVLVVICESRGLSNLTPSRSRIFKLMGRQKVCEVELQQALAYMVAKLTQKIGRREGKARSRNYDQEVILDYLRSSISPTPCSLPGLRRKGTITVTHAVDAF